MAKLQKNPVIFSLLLIDFFLIGYRILSLWNHFFPDFNVFYYSARLVLHHQNPYSAHTLFTNLNYPVVSLLFFLPFTALPFSVAENIFLSINIFSLIAIIYISLLLNKQNTLLYVLLFLLGSLLFFPTNFTLGMGQSNLVAYVFLLIGYYFNTKGKSIPSVIFLAIAYTMKPILAFTMLFFLFQKQRSTFFGILLFGGALCGISCIFFGIGYYHYYFLHVLPQLFHMQGREIYYNQGITGFIARLTPHIQLRTVLSLTLECILLISVVWISLIKNVSKNVHFSLFLTALVLFDGLSWQHHFVFLLFPFIVTFFLIQKEKQFAFYSVLLGTSIVLVGTNIKQPNYFSTYPTTLLLSHVFYGAVILFFLLLFLIFRVKRITTILPVISYSLFLIFLLAQYFLFISCRSTICFY